MTDIMHQDFISVKVKTNKILKKYDAVRQRN